jgi:general secretion pathway protein M
MSGVSIGGWWRRRSQRERILLAAMASALAVHLLFAGAARPLLEARATALAAIAQHDAALVRLAGLSEWDEPVASTEPVTAIVTASAAGYDLTIRRIEAEDEGARLEIEDAGFPELVLWIEELERAHALRLVAIEIDRRPEPGVVGARLTLGR